MAKIDFTTPEYFSPSSFYFILKFNGVEDMDSMFQEVSGLKVTIGTGENKEGGESDFVHHLPAQPKYENLVLKRCLMSNSKLEKWCRDALERFAFDPKRIQLLLLRSDGITLASWTIENAYPISWELASLNDTDDELAIETLTLKYRNFKRDL